MTSPAIGSNDPTQLVLGVDRDSETVAFDFDEVTRHVLAVEQRLGRAARGNDGTGGRS